MVAILDHVGICVVRITTARVHFSVVYNQAGAVFLSSGVPSRSVSGDKGSVSSRSPQIRTIAVLCHQHTITIAVGGVRIRLVAIAVAFRFIFATIRTPSPSVSGLRRSVPSKASISSVRPSPSGRHRWVQSNTASSLPYELHPSYPNRTCPYRPPPASVH